MAQHDGSITLETKVDTKGITNSTGDIKIAADKAGKSFKNLSNTISKALMEGDTKTAQLANQFQKATSEVEKQTEKVAELKAHLAQLENGEIKIQGNGISKLQTDFDKTTASVTKTQNEITELYMQLERLQTGAFTAPDTGEIVLTGKEQAEFDKLNAKLDALEPKLEQEKRKANELGEALKNAMGAATQAEIDKTKAKLIEMEKSLLGLRTKAEIAGQKLQEEMKTSNNGTSQVSAGIGRMGTKLTQLAKGALVFSAITKGFTMLRQNLGNALMSNEGFKQSLYQLQTAFWTAFAPIYNYVLPAIQTLVNWITAAVVNVGKFIAMLTGKSYSAMADSGKKLQQQTAAYKAVGSGSNKAAKAMKKTTDEAKKQVAAFDELNILSEDKAEPSNDVANGVGGGGASASIPNIDTAQLDEVSEKMQGIAVIVGSIGAGLLAWKISDFVNTLQKGGAEATKLQGNLKSFGGCFMIIAGAILLVKGYSDAWVNGIDWGNFALILGGLALVIGGIALAVSPVAAAFAAVGGAIALLVLGVKDFLENGATFQNILLIIIGIVGIFAATLWALTAAEVAAALPIALIVAAVAALVAGFILLWNKCEGFRNFWINLWEKVKNTAINIWENSLKPAFESIKEKWGDLMSAFQRLWDAVSPLFAAIGNVIAGIFGKGGNADESLENSEESFRGFETIIDIIITSISGMINGIITVLTGVIDFLTGMFSGDWETCWNGIQTIIDGVFDFIEGIFGEGSTEGIRQILHGIIDFIKNVFNGDWSAAWESIKSIINTVFELFDNIFGEGSSENIKTILNGITNFITGVFSGDWKKAWQGIKDVFKGVVNSIIDMWEGGLNKLVDLINTLSFDVPDWVPKIGGTTFGFNLQHIHIPRLAQGAVIPANKEFLAVLGDQKQGVNIETPLDTMIQAFKTALSEFGGSGEQTVILQLDGREVGRTFGEAIRNESRRTGASFVKPKIVFG